jgi:hypothetical protein
VSQPSAPMRFLFTLAVPALLLTVAHVAASYYVRPTCKAAMEIGNPG